MSFHWFERPIASYFPDLVDRNISIITETVASQAVVPATPVAAAPVAAPVASPAAAVATPVAKSDTQKGCSVGTW